jgi:anaerobic selenocysteine-containing dehydrogenase
MKTNRRDFLKKSGLTAAGTAFMGYNSGARNSSISDKVYPAG